MEEINQNQIKNLKKIADSIQNLKNLKTINFNEDHKTFGSVLIVENNLTKIQYAIKIISVFDGYDGICQEKLENAKKEADFLMQCSHPNVVQYIDQFQIHFNYFIQIEKCEKNLEQWINQQNKVTISKHQFLSFACQTLSAIQYFHNNNYVLRDFSLQSILVDRYNRIKLYDFGLSKNVHSEINQKKFLKYYPKGEMFYFPPEIINQLEEQRSINKEFEQSFQLDVWKFGICFSIIGGATLKNCQQIHHSGYKYIKSLDENINKILQNILSQQPNERPSIEQIIKEFEILKQEIWKPQHANILFTEYQKIQNDNIKKALELILICIDISPENINYQLQLGYIQQQLKYFDESIQSYLKCLEINSKNDIYLNNLGLEYCKKGMMDEAIKQFQKCLEINPKNENCYNSLGHAYQYKGLVDESIQLYLKCLEINPKNDNCLNSLGSAYYNKGMVDEAILQHLKCLEINPKNGICFYNLGSAYSKKGMVDEEIQSYLKCLETNPENDICFNNLGIAYANKGMVDEAIQSYQKCLEINPKNDNCYNSLGMSYSYKGMVDESIKSFLKCLEINPKNEDGCHNLSFVYFNKGLINEAIKSFQKRLQINPQNYDCQFYLGSAFHQKNMMDDAIKQYEKCLKLNKDKKSFLENQIKICKFKI